MWLSEMAVSHCMILSFCFVTVVCMPQCCHKPINNPNFLSRRKCAISLCQSKEVNRHLCISCVPALLTADFTSQSFTTARITKPQLSCYDSTLENGVKFGLLILSWSWVQTAVPSIFVIESRNFSRQFHEWNIVGMTNETSVRVSNLRFDHNYQFRVTPVISPDTTLPSMVSDQTFFSDFESLLPKNINFSKFYLKNNLLEGIVTWKKPKACFYNLLLKPASDKENGKYIISLTHLNSSALFSDLAYNTNYTLSFFSHESEKETLLIGWFVTPSCLNIAKGNFSFCHPNFPRNMSITWFPEINEALLSWEPPMYTLKRNPILGYYISVGEALDQYQIIVQHTSYLPAVSRNTVISDLKSGTHYIFEVRAKYRHIVGSAGTIDLRTNELQVLHLLASGFSHYHTVPVSVSVVTISVLLMFLVVPLAIYKFHFKKENKAQNSVCMYSDLYDANRPHLILPTQIALKEVVGQGAFGVVHRGIFTRSKCQCEVAIKVFPTDYVTVRQFLHEVDMLSLIGRHSNIVEMHGFAMDTKKMYLVLEYCPIGDLHTYLVKLKPKLMHLKNIPIAERTNVDKTYYGVQLCSYIYQVAKGMEYISSLKLIHRDIAARNILLHSKKIVKIADFGLSKDVYQTKNYLMQTQKKLPIKWMAPEAIEKKIFNTLTDVWSFGVFMWEVFKIGKEPYHKLQNDNILQYLKSGYRLQHPHCHRELYDIMCACWQLNPQDRPQFKELAMKIGAMTDKLSKYVVLP